MRSRPSCRRADCHELETSLFWWQAFAWATFVWFFWLPPYDSLGQATKEPRGFPSPTTVDLETKDGILIQATFYGQPLGTKAIPVVLLHDFRSNRNAFETLASGLQQAGYCVLVPDLRGHGNSNKVRGARTGQSQTIDVTDLRKADIHRMIEFDMEALRKFLVVKNDAQELNLENLCLVGAGMGATIALNWTVKDWNAPPLAVGKQGQDVKTLVLISPERMFKNISVQSALEHPAIRDHVTILILVGTDSPKSLKDANRMYKTLERLQRNRPGPKNKRLFLKSFDTSLQGISLLKAESSVLIPGIAKFIDATAAQKNYPWSSRRTSSP